MTRTNKFRILSLIFGLLSLTCFFAPPIYFIVEALLTSTLAYQKIALCSTVMAVIIMSVVAVVNKIALRSRIWILIFGLWLCLDNFLLPFLIIGGCQIADEVIFSPLYKYFKTKLTINRELDIRLKEK